MSGKNINKREVEEKLFSSESYKFNQNQYESGAISKILQRETFLFYCSYHGIKVTIPGKVEMENTNKGVKVYIKVDSNYYLNENRGTSGNKFCEYNLEKLKNKCIPRRCGYLELITGGKENSCLEVLRMEDKKEQSYLVREKILIDRSGAKLSHSKVEKYPIKEIKVKGI